MSAVFAGWVTPGATIHIAPHDIYFGDRKRTPVHRETPEADVCVEAVIIVGNVAVICWRATTGRPCGAVVYDSNDLVECVTEAAA